MVLQSSFVQDVVPLLVVERSHLGQLDHLFELNRPSSLQKMPLKFPRLGKIRRLIGPKLVASPSNRKNQTI